MFRIGEFSKMSKTTIKTLRYYDKEGILKPEAVDRDTGYRMYTTNQLINFHKIQSLRQIGVSIEDIKAIMLNTKSIYDVLMQRRLDITLEISSIKDQLSRIDFILSGKEENDIMKYQAIVKKLPECIVYTVETVIPNYDAYFKIIPPIGEKLKKKYPDLKATSPEYCFVKYLDGEYREKDIHIEYSEAVNKIEEDFDNVVFKKVESVEAVTVMHKGPYSTISNAYAYIMKWIEENGYEMTDYPRESYIDGIWNKEDPNEWLTEVQFPIKK